MSIKIKAKIIYGIELSPHEELSKDKIEEIADTIMDSYFFIEYYGLNREFCALAAKTLETEIDTVFYLNQHCFDIKTCCGDDMIDLVKKFQLDINIEPKWFLACSVA